VQAGAVWALIRRMGAVALTRRLTRDVTAMRMMRKQSVWREKSEEDEEEGIPPGPDHGARKGETQGASRQRHSP